MGIDRNKKVTRKVRSYSLFKVLLLYFFQPKNGKRPLKGMNSHQLALQVLMVVPVRIDKERKNKNEVCSILVLSFIFSESIFFQPENLRRPREGMNSHRSN